MLFHLSFPATVPLMTKVGLAGYLQKGGRVGVEPLNLWRRGPPNPSMGLPFLKLPLVTPLHWPELKEAPSLTHQLVSLVLLSESP